MALMYNLITTWGFCKKFLPGLHKLMFNHNVRVAYTTHFAMGHKILTCGTYDMCYFGDENFLFKKYILYNNHSITIENKIE